MTSVWMFFTLLLVPANCVPLAPGQDPVPAPTPAAQPVGPAVPVPVPVTAVSPSTPPAGEITLAPVAAAVMGSTIQIPAFRRRKREANPKHHKTFKPVIFK